MLFALNIANVNVCMYYLNDVLDANKEREMAAFQLIELPIN